MLSSSSASVEVPQDRQETCVGPESADAGRAAACQGCPNATLCASGALKKGSDPDLPLIAARLRGVKLRLLILSGKGGVGKSTVTKELAFALARRGLEVGVLDADICGPSQPRMLNAKMEDVHLDGQGICPVGVREGVSMMSIHFFMGDDQKNDAVTWRGPQKNNMLKNFLKQVNWTTTASSSSSSAGAGGKQNARAALDCLLIDTPPGTTDEHITLASTLMSIQKKHDEEYEERRALKKKKKKSNTTTATSPSTTRQREEEEEEGGKGNDENDDDDDDDDRVKTCAIVVTTPQKISVNDVRRELSFCVKAKLPVLGLVVNMDGFVCPCCNKVSNIFPNAAGSYHRSNDGGGEPTKNAADLLAQEFNIPVIGRLPLDPNVMKASDAGMPLVEKEEEEDKKQNASSDAAAAAAGTNKKKRNSNGESPSVAAVEDMVDKVMDLCGL